MRMIKEEKKKYNQACQIIQKIWSHERKRKTINDKRRKEEIQQSMSNYTKIWSHVRKRKTIITR